jgi:ABC-2 type transport system permease protein
MQAASLVVPVRWAMDGFDAVTWRGLGLSGAMPAFGVLLAFTLVFSLFAAYRLRWA